MELSVQRVTDEQLGSDSAWLVAEWIRIFYLGCGSSACSFVVASLGGSVGMSAHGADAKTNKPVNKT